jgi:hypothetical protein
MDNPNTTQSYGHKIAVAFDMFVGVLWHLPYDMTISSYAGLVRYGVPPMKDAPLPGARMTKWFWIPLANALDQLEAHHCDGAIEADEARARAAIEDLQQVPTKNS